MKTERLIHGEMVFGVDVDSQTRCAHWHGELDIIAIKFKCCRRYFPCYECHAKLETHQPEVWVRTEFSEKAVLCGGCGFQLAINEYLECDSICPRCAGNFNPGCANHYHLYFKSEPPA